MPHPLFEKILIENGYQTLDGKPITYVDYYKAAPTQLVEHYADIYNINTDCHNACINCQIDHLNKYPDETSWAVRDKQLAVYKKVDRRSRVLLRLKQYQHVRLIERASGDMWKIQVDRYIGECMRSGPEHGKFAAMSRGALSGKRCSECNSEFSITMDSITGWVERKGITGFLVRCDFIPETYSLPAEMEAGLSDDEIDLALSTIDPSTWSRRFLGRNLRPHQEISNRCTAQRKVLRWGRRSGKTYGTAINLLNFAMNYQFPEGTDTDGNPVYRGAVILILSPFLSQIEMIFDNLNELLKRNTELHSLRIRHVKTPYHQMEFSNGALIKGFTTGANSKQEASTVRGMSADLIYADEVDFIPTDDLKKAIEPILLTYSHAQMWASSTPKGSREWFYKSCKETPHFKEFYFPSTVLDNWDEVKSTLDMTHDAFMQEYMADFIAQQMGVYQPHFVGAAELPYEYNQPAFSLYGEHVTLDRPMSTWVYSIGVDWNTTAGTEIVVVGQSPQGQCVVVEALNVPKQDWQMIKAENAIFALHAKWNAQFIYVDAGYGVGQIEHMQAASMNAGMNDPNHPDAQIGPKIKPYDFSRKIEFRDPNTGVLKKTLAKPFLVENSIRYFENGLISFPGSDMVLHNQLLNYIRQSVSITGIPRYGMNNDKIGDHRLDALNLALVAFKLEMTAFAKDAPAVTSIAMSKGFGTGRGPRPMPHGQAALDQFRDGIPLRPDGQPSVGLDALYVHHDSEYIKMREGERILEQRSDRTSRSGSMDDPHVYARNSENSETVDRPGFYNDQEWKFKLEMSQRKAGARVHRRRLGKPRRNKI